MKVAAIMCLTTTENLQQTVAFSADMICPTATNKTTDENIGDFMNINKSTIDEIKGDLHTSALTPQGELSRWHYRLGHLSFPKMKDLMQHSIFPSKLLTVKPPVCACCLAGAMTKQPSRVKGGKRHLHTATKPGEYVSVDQLESRTPGFLAVLRGFVTNKRYTCATIFVDHYSRFTYYYPQTSTNAEETVKAKKAFEAYSDSVRVNILHCHCDNGRFADKVFLAAVKDEKQTVLYCGVNAHHQNGIAEKKIRDSQESARKMVLFAKSKWPKAIRTNIWPYAQAHAINILNYLPTFLDGISPLEKYTRTTVRPKLKTFHTFGCPVFTLDSRLEAGQSIPK